MEKKEQIICKALLDQQPQGIHLLQFLPNEEASDLKSLPSFPLFDLNAYSNVLGRFQEIHFSWFITPLKNMPPDQRVLFFPLFDPFVQKQLEKLVEVPKAKTHIPKSLHNYLANYLLEKMSKEILPKSLLAQTPSLILLTLSLKELLHLIDLLAMLDLAAEMRQIVDKNLLTKISASLTPSQLKFLQYASKQSMKYTPKKLDLSYFDGDKKKLYQLLHQRGLIRLANGIVDEDSHFKWHLLHKLDTGRASMIEKNFNETQTSELTKFFKKELLNLTKRRLKK